MALGVGDAFRDVDLLAEALDDGLSGRRRLGMYRWHVMDPIRFAEKLRVTIQALGWRAPLEGQKRYLPSRTTSPARRSGTRRSRTRPPRRYRI